MGPLRILILAGLVYLGYRLIKSNFSKSGENEKSEDESPRPGGAITDVLIEDPVCRKLIPKQQAYTLEADDGPHYFCSKECGDKFAAEREKSDQNRSSDDQ
ncbi:MAG: TRASH domain protein [Desulfobulbia bacterium]